MSEDQLTVLKDIRRILKKILELAFRPYEEGPKDLPAKEKG